MHCGKRDSGAVSLQGAVQSVSGGNPLTVQVMTDPVSVTTAMTSAATGTLVTANLQSALRLFDGRQYALGFAAVNARLAHGYRPSSDPGQPAGANDLVYRRSPTVLPPVDGWSSSADLGWMSVWLTTESNVAPNAPVTVTIAGVSSTDFANPAQIGTLTPLVTGSFSDANEIVGPFGVGSADKLKNRQYQIIRVSDAAVVYDSQMVACSVAEQNARLFNDTYGGPALAANTTYKLRCRVTDLFDAASDWSAYRYFTIVVGNMDTATTPTGKQTTQTPGPFATVWHHTGGLSTNAVQVSIRDADSGTILRSSAAIAKTVANNAASSVTWAQTGFAALDWGANLVWAMRGRDTNGNWGSYSANQPFTVDAAPSVPANQAPANNAVVTIRPLLAVTVSDADDAQTALTVKFRIKDASGTVLFTRTATRNAGNGRFEYQTTSTDLTGFATYAWDAYSFDGTVYSGGTTVEASASKSGQRTFAYVSGPQTAITSPTDGGTVPTAVPTITWTVTQQTSRTVTVTRLGVLVHTNTSTTTVKSYTLPSTLSTGEVLEEGDVVTIAVDVVDSGGIHGAASVTVTVDYPTPPSLNLSADLALAEGDVTPSFVRLTWPQSTYPISDAGAGAFYSYRLARKPSGGAIAANPDLDNVWTTIAVIKSPTLTTYDDHTARAGVEYVWRLKHYVLANGVSLLGSAPNYQYLTVHFDATIIHDARDPSGTRIVLAARDDRTITPISDIAVLMPWNQGKPIHLHGETDYVEVDCTYAVVAESPQAASAIIRRAQAMAKNGGPLHYRDGRGNSFWGEFAEPPVETDKAGGAPRKLKVHFRELAWSESVEGE